ncbi:unnamed protein product [Parnassius apollo]|uniref:(apollo) hypothetical protein n=1 Tax=Parnassius apollo TaxID=110799 RepID=A0A8S3WYH6_PARAO|nr:unnamed protein product [Parnassius apollo]
MLQRKQFQSDICNNKFGYGWTRSGQRRCRTHRPPESTMSVSSDIRFTRRKLSRPCRGAAAPLSPLCWYFCFSPLSPST